MSKETIKPWRNCKNCSGTGLVQIAPNVRGLKRCAFCQGTGRVEPIRDINKSSYERKE